MELSGIDNSINSYLKNLYGFEFNFELNNELPANVHSEVRQIELDTKNFGLLNKLLKKFTIRYFYVVRKSPLQTYIETGIKFEYSFTEHSSDAFIVRYYFDMNGQEIDKKKLND